MSDLKHCECEHIAHFDKGWLTPNGNPGHRADALFHRDCMKHVRTPYGLELVCPDCADDCRAVTGVLK